MARAFTGRRSSAGKGVISIVDRRDSIHAVHALRIVSIFNLLPKRTKAAK